MGFARLSPKIILHFVENRTEAAAISPEENKWMVEVGRHQIIHSKPVTSRLFVKRSTQIKKIMLTFKISSSKLVLIFRQSFTLLRVEGFLFWEWARISGKWTWRLKELFLVLSLSRLHSIFWHFDQSDKPLFHPQIFQKVYRFVSELRSQYQNMVLDHQKSRVF